MIRGKAEIKLSACPYDQRFGFAGGLFTQNLDALGMRHETARHLVVERHRRRRSHANRHKFFDVMFNRGPVAAGPASDG